MNAPLFALRFLRFVFVSRSEKLLTGGLLCVMAFFPSCPQEPSLQQFSFLRVRICAGPHSKIQLLQRGTNNRFRTRMTLNIVHAARSS